MHAAAHRTNRTSSEDREFVFTYDYMGRRVRKQAFAWTGSAWSAKNRNGDVARKQPED